MPEGLSVCAIASDVWVFVVRAGNVFYTRLEAARPEASAANARWFRPSSDPDEPNNALRTVKAVPITNGLMLFAIDGGLQIKAIQRVNERWQSWANVQPGGQEDYQFNGMAVGRSGQDVFLLGLKGKGLQELLFDASGTRKGGWSRVLMPQGEGWDHEWIGASSTEAGMFLFARHANDELHHAFRQAGKTWEGWRQAQTEVDIRQGSVAQLAEDQFLVAGLRVAGDGGTTEINGYLTKDDGLPDEGSKSWSRLGSAPEHKFTDVAAVTAGGRALVFGIRDREILFTSYSVSSSWSNAWTVIKGPTGAKDATPREE